ncbi:type IV secretory system conjugative DNA transfer family protein [Acidithiobacillus sp. IBUN Pt1247-S3]|uniref:type IV secretory system conjugative DNA transfer family protein n=1 Tax=Acidithiobacillus sp. IBUN Pt1247-S3 TaxID=3166642 RepID=UPI0034E60197
MGVWRAGFWFCALVVVSPLAFADSPAGDALPSGGYSEQQLLAMQGGDGAFVQDQVEAPFRDARQRAVEAAGETFASQEAYCAGVSYWNDWANGHADILDRAFRFSSLLLDAGRVLPPVILQDDRSFVQDGDAMAVTAQTTWKIYREGKIVSTAPNWRGYLLQSCGKPLRPNPVLLPKDAKDEMAWKEGVREGWKQGLRMAKDGFLLGLHRLTRDYGGMLRFWWLSQRGIVQAPILSTGDVGIRVDGRTLSVGERIFRLTDSGSFRPGSKWATVTQALDDPGKGLPVIRLEGAPQSVNGGNTAPDWQHSGNVIRMAPK